MLDKSAASSRRFHLKTYGCQMNVYDSQRIHDLMSSASWTSVEDPLDADLLVLNTCHIRDKAVEKVYSEIGRFRKLRNSRLSTGKDFLIAVLGCIAQAEGREIMQRAPSVQLVVGPQNYHMLPHLIKQVETGHRVLATEVPESNKFDVLPLPDSASIISRAPSAFLTVQEGCDKFCSFCVVPYTRGIEVSRSVSGIMEEAKLLVRSSVCEITLLGQNVNAYNGKGVDGETWGLARLLRELAEIKGLQRLRYTTSHPVDMDEDLIAAHRDLPKLMPFLHLPVQSGSDRMLRAMNRRHTRAEYMQLINKIRMTCPDIALSGDFIVGFPGETEEDFLETLSIVKEAEYASGFSFKYSRRPGTPAASSSDQVPEPVKSERLSRLQAVINECTYSFNTSRIGMKFEVLFSKKGEKPGQMLGWSPWLQPVHVQCEEDLVGKLLPVKIEDARGYSLFGVFAS